MKIYRLKGNINKDCSYMRRSGMPYEEQEKLLSGNLVTMNEFAEYEIVGLTKKKPDVYTIGNTEFYVNDKFKDFCIENNKSDNNIEFLKIEIENKNYYLLNLLNNIECFDWEKSEYTTYSNKYIINEVTKLVIDENKLGNRKMFRMKEYKFEIFVVDSLKIEMEKTGFSGISFIESMDLTIG